VKRSEINRERTRQRTKARRGKRKSGRPEILAANGDQKRDLAQRRRGAEGVNEKIICLGFYSRGFASFAGQGGFAADLGRFGETTLPFFSMDVDALPPEGPGGATPSK
jgi:hypothetical protein